MFLGIDIGSSFIKYALLNINDNTLCNVKRVITPDLLENNDMRIKEYSPQKLFEAIKSEIDIRIAESAIDGILLSTQMHGFILVNDGGENISNYVSWQDERALNKSPNCDHTYLECADNLIAKEQRKLAGATSRINLSIYPLYQFMQTNIVEEGMRFMMLGDYIAYMLTGNYPKIHITNAASTGMVDLEKGTWNEEIINALGFEGLKFPQITYEISCSGEYKGVEIYSAVGDQQVSILGMDEPANKDLLINISTGTQVSMVSDELVFGDYETRPYFDGKCLLTNTDVVSGRNIEVVVDYLADNNQSSKSLIWSKICSIDEKLLSRGKIPAVNLDFCALEDGFQGYLKNILEDTFTIEEIALGAFVDLVNKIYVASEKIIRNKTIDRILLSGGLAQSVKMLRNIIENFFRLECILNEEKEESLFGLLKLAKKLQFF